MIASKQMNKKSEKEFINMMCIALSFTLVLGYHKTNSSEVSPNISHPNILIKIDSPLFNITNILTTNNVSRLAKSWLGR